MSTIQTDSSKISKEGKITILLGIIGILISLLQYIPSINKYLSEIALMLGLTLKTLITLLLLTILLVWISYLLLICIKKMKSKKIKYKKQIEPKNYKPLIDIPVNDINKIIEIMLDKGIINKMTLVNELKYTKGKADIYLQTLYNADYIQPSLLNFFSIPSLFFGNIFYKITDYGEKYAINNKLV